MVVLVDRDDDDCRPPQLELEAWSFGDWGAVRAAYPRVSATIPDERRYRRPHAVVGGTWEALERALQAAGYFQTGGPRKVEAARAIAEHMQPARNTSPSFRAMRAALEELTAPSAPSPSPSSSKPRSRGSRRSRG
ncbi:MAG: DUF4276 family protein [Polyangiaceae bacterium]|nr:DUF4276 family protein [Polyangiaceae bacterium]